MTTTATRPVTEETTNTEASKSTSRDGSRGRSRGATAVTVGADTAAAVKTAAADAATRLPALMAKGRSAFDDANRGIDSSSDEMVRLATVLSFGVAAGLLVGGAPRILVGAALVPVGMLGLTLLERSAAGRSGGLPSKATTGS